MKLRKLAWLAVLSTALMLVGVVIVAQAPTPRIWLDTDSQQVAAGQEFTATIQVNGAVDVYGGSVKLSYDPQAVEVVLIDDKAVTPGAFFADQPGFTLKNTAAEGVIEYALTLIQPAQPVSGDGVLGTLTLRALTAGTVAITPVETRLLSPVFVEIDGRQVAQQINEVAVNAETLTLNPGSGQPDAAVSAPAEAVEPVAPAVAAPADVAAPAVSAPVEQPVVAVPAAPVISMPVVSGGPSPVVLAGALLFVAGLSLFTLSIGAYVGLRREAEMREVSW